MKKLSLITTCMGRLDHLKRTLPQRIHPDIENIVVDWSCPNRAGDWIQSNYGNDVIVIKVRGQRHYNRSISRNTALQAATGEFVCNADADLMINPHFYDYILPLLDQNWFISAIPLRAFIPGLCMAGRFSVPISLKAFYTQWLTSDRTAGNERVIHWTDERDAIRNERLSLSGFLIFPRRVYERIGGYDEIYDRSDCGGEDVDYRIRLIVEGKLGETVIKKGIIESIEHDDQSRLLYLDLQETNLFRATYSTLQKIAAKWGEETLRDVSMLSLMKHEG